MVYPNYGILLSNKTTNYYIIQQQNKGAIYQATKRHGGNLNAYCQVKAVSLRRLCKVFFQLYDILEKAKLWTVKRLMIALFEEGGNG